MSARRSVSVQQSFTNRSVTAFLGGVCLVQAIASLRAESEDGTMKNALGACVCLVAFLHYTWMRSAKSRGEKTELRFADWIITCPLLLWELHFLTRNTGSLWLMVGLCTVMLGLGVASERSRSQADGEGRRLAYFLSSSVVFSALAAYFLLHARSETKLASGFFAVWGLYPIAFLSQGRWSDFGFDLLDMVSKGGFGLYVAFRSTKDTES